MAAKLKPQMWQASAGSGHDSGESTEANSGRQDGDEDVERRNHGDLPAHGGNVRATSGDETYQDSAGHDQQSVTDIERNDHDDARTMRAILVESYGDTSRLLSKDVKRPSDPKGHDILIRVKASSVNPVDTKVRAGTYDDYPDYYDHVPKPYQILGFDGAGIVENVGAEVKEFQPGDEVFYSGSPIRHGSNAELQLVDSRAVAKKPSSLDFAQAAAMPLTWITAYEALVERMNITKGEKAGVLIINGSGGVGSVASQIARVVLKLPVVVTTASRPETVEFSKSMGATHTVNHREDIVPQIKGLKLDVPLKYIFITHSTDVYLAPCAAVCAPFGTICSIVQTQRMDKMYGTEFMAKSLTFVWELLGTKPYYGVDVDSHGKILRELAQLLDDGQVKCHLKQRLKMNEAGIREGHEIIQGGSSMGKVGLDVDQGDDKSGKAAFC